MDDIQLPQTNNIQQTTNKMTCQELMKKEFAKVPIWGWICVGCSILIIIIMIICFTFSIREGFSDQWETGIGKIRQKVYVNENNELDHKIEINNEVENDPVEFPALEVNDPNIIRDLNPNDDLPPNTENFVSANGRQPIYEPISDLQNIAMSTALQGVEHNVLIQQQKDVDNSKLVQNIDHFKQRQSLMPMQATDIKEVEFKNKQSQIIQETQAHQNAAYAAQFQVAPNNNVAIGARMYYKDNPKVVFNDDRPNPNFAFVPQQVIADAKFEQSQFKENYEPPSIPSNTINNIPTIDKDKQVNDLVILDNDQLDSTFDQESIPTTRISAHFYKQYEDYIKSSYKKYAQLLSTLSTIYWLHRIFDKEIPSYEKQQNNIIFKGITSSLPITIKNKIKDLINQYNNLEQNQAIVSFLLKYKQKYGKYPVNFMTKQDLIKYGMQTGTTNKLEKYIAMMH